MTDQLKVFAMTNQLLEADLDRLERELGVDLGRQVGESGEKDVEYYPQFDAAVRSEAQQMGEHYEVFYCLERTIRQMIAESMGANRGATWWDAGAVPERIHTDVAERMQREVDSAITIRSDAPIDYTTFGELAEIIKHNWDVFGGTFNSRRALEKVMANLNTLRGPIAHCSPLAPDEIVRLELSVRDWFRLME